MFWLVVEVVGCVVDASSLSLFTFPGVAAFFDEVVTVSASSAALLVRNSCSPWYRKLLSCEVALSLSFSFNIAEVCFAGSFLPMNNWAIMVYFSYFGDVADKTEVCFAGSFLSINDGAPILYVPGF